MMILLYAISHEKRFLHYFLFSSSILIQNPKFEVTLTFPMHNFRYIIHKPLLGLETN